MKKLIIMLSAFLCAACGENKAPNIVLILADDLGYGDLGAYGATLINTPNIDKLAAQGAKLTQFYTSGNVCTPSRAGMLTGRYPIRTGLADRTLGVDDTRGLKQSEATLSEQLRSLGYVSALIGKWHLGDRPEYHPLEHGFSEFFGVIHSNDQPNQPLLKGVKPIESPINAQMLALRFIDESVDFIQRNQKQPFFLMLSSTSPHKPLIPSPEFAGRSQAGAYGDVVQELDWGVGKLMAALEKAGIADNTLVIVTSDNGPFPEGSTGGLRGGKGTSWDGGYRVPFIAHWPKSIEPGTTSSAMAMNIDLLPTLIAIASNQSEQLTDIDGKDIQALFTGSNQSPHEVLYFFNNERIAALRTQKWRLVLNDYPPWRDAQPIRFEGKQNLYTLMYDMELSAEQQYDMSRDYPKQKQKLVNLLRDGRDSLESLSSLPDSNQYGDSYKN